MTLVHPHGSTGNVSRAERSVTRPGRALANHGPYSSNSKIAPGSLEKHGTK